MNPYKATDLPHMARIKQHHPTNEIEDAQTTARDELFRAGIADMIKPGQRIAIACGSRGIGAYAEVVRGAIEAVKTAGGSPIIIPAMGSHGGATGKGQTDVLAQNGITEKSMGTPIMADMEVATLGTIPAGPPVYFSRRALEMDGVVVINRVKPHTSFNSDFGSGLIKMLVIGLGKDRGAQAIHAYGVRGLCDMIPAAAKIILDKVSVLPGLAIVENALGRPAVIKALDSKRFFANERELMQLARKYMPRLPVEELDLLVVDKMGKDISGSGMDTNVIGRLGLAGIADFETPRIRRIVVLDLSSASYGNAAGIGLADVITDRLLAKIDMEATRINTITSAFLERGRIPLSMPSDREAINLGMQCSWQPDKHVARVMRIASTLELTHLFASRAVWEQLRGRAEIETLSAPSPWRFTANGELNMPW